MTDHFEIVNGGTRVVTLRGELDAHDAPTLRTTFSEALEGAPPQPRVVLDLTQVTFLDSTALGCIVGLLRDRKSTRLNSSHSVTSRMPSSA